MILSAITVFFWTVGEWILNLLVPDDPAETSQPTLRERLMKLYGIPKVGFGRWKQMFGIESSLGPSMRNWVSLISITSDVVIAFGVGTGVSFLFLIAVGLYLVLGTCPRIFLEAWIESREQQRINPLRFVEAVSDLEPGDAQINESVISTEQAHCAVCGEELEYAVVYCERCGTPHHFDCWKYLGKCSVYGCGGKKSRLKSD